MSYSRVRLGYLAEVRPSGVDKKSVEGETPVRLCNYTDVYYGDRILPSPDFMEATATAAQLESLSLRRGDVVMTKDSETADDIAVSAYVAEDLPGVLLGYHCALVRPRPGVDGRFLHWALQSSVLRDYFSQIARGVTRVGMRQEDIARAMVPLPPHEAQMQIARRLDDETEHIDSLVEANRKLRQLLDERRMALLIRGLLLPMGFSSPEAFLADRSTRAPRIKHVIRGSFAGNTPEAADAAWTDADNPRAVPWLGIGNLTHGGETYAGDRFLEADSLPRLRLRPHGAGTLLFAMYGATAGKVARLSTTATWNQAVLGLVPDESVVEGEFLYLWLQIAGPAARSLARSNTQDNFNAEQVLNFRVPLPDRGEQRRVIELFREAATHHEAASTLLRRQNDLLSERRQALITAAVTGQLGVGEAA